MPIRRNTRTLCPTKVKALKALAGRIDELESAEIKMRGRELFNQHHRLRKLVQQLRAERLRQRLSLGDLAERTGIAKPNLSRLENGRGPMPSLETLQRYAHALGKTVRLKLANAA